MPVPRAGVIHDQCDVEGTPEVIFEYLATFSNTAEWDPGCLEGKRADSGPLGVGSKFDLVTTFKGSKSNMTYQIIKFDRPNYVELKGQSDTVTVIDMISLSKNGDKTHVDYKVDLTLKGWRRPFIAFLGGALNTLGKDAMDGMRNVLTRERVAELEKDGSISSAASE